MRTRGLSATHATCQFYTPTEFDAGLEWLQKFGHQMIRKL